MTILVAVKKNGRMWLGADRITVFGNEYFTDLVGGTKIIKLKNAYLATSGYTLLDNVIEHLHSTNHKMMDNPFASRADVFGFFLELYGELKKGYTLVDTGKDTYAGIYNVFFVITTDRIYGVSNNLSVYEYPLYAAKGAGSDYALGCLYGIYDTIDDGYELVRLSLEAACQFSVYCKEPLDIIEVLPSDFGKHSKNYKALGKGLRTLPRSKGAGNLIDLAKAYKATNGKRAIEREQPVAAVVQKKSTGNGKRPVQAKAIQGKTTARKSTAGKKVAATTAAKTAAKTNKRGKRKR